MISDLKPYPAIKSSGVPWLGDVPEHWEVRRGKWLFRHKKQLNTERNSSNVLSLTLRGVVNNDPNNPEGLVPNDYATYQLFCKNNLVFKLIDLENFRTSRVGLVHEDGIMSSAYVRLVPHSIIDIRFFFQQYFDLYQRGIYNQLGAGVRSTLGAADLLNIGMAVPPLSEQAAIVRFLDYADQRIGRYIRAKQKLIKLLEEQKQAIIHRAVTRGLDPNVRLKPSDVEWLGELPAHWQVLALRRRWSVTDCKHLTVPFLEDGGGFPLASVREVQPFELSLTNAKRTSREYYEKLIDGDRKPRKGDLIYCRNVSVGAAAVVMSEEPMAMGQDVCLIRSNGENQRYLNYFLRSPAMQRQLSMILVGSTFNRINVADIKALTIVVPPRSEQDAIVRFLDEELNEVVLAQGVAGDEISLLREHSTRLIADVVTGKLDVREAASRLSEEFEEPEPLDETDALNDAEDAPELDEADDELAEAV